MTRDAPATCRPPFDEVLATMNGDAGRATPPTSSRAA